MSRYGGNPIDKQVVYMGHCNNAGLILNHIYHAIKESMKFDYRYLIERNDDGFQFWYKVNHFKEIKEK